MLIHKTFEYRIYPNKSTISRFDQWNSALIWLWNLCNEQRKLGYGRPKGERIYPTAFDQGKELTQLRKEADWINDVPRHVCVSILDRLDKAWKRSFEKSSRQPRWKKKHQRISFTEFDKTKFHIKNGELKFPKLPPIPIVLSRPLEGKSKSCTIKRDGDQWFVFIVCEIEIPDPAPRTEPKVGIDRGVRNVFGDTNGRLLQNPKFFEKSRKLLARRQKDASRKQKGSNNQRKAFNRVSKLHRRIRRQREHFLHVESTRYAKSHGVVVLEKLETKNMIRVKGGLARNIADAAWGMFGRMLKYKLEWSGGSLCEVDPKYTSQTCFKCGHIDRNSRCGDKFKCTNELCGHEDHADLNAPKVILGRWSPASQPVEASSQRTRRRSRKLKSDNKEMA